MYYVRCLITIAGDHHILDDYNPREAWSLRGGQHSQRISIRVLAPWDLHYGESFKAGLRLPDFDEISCIHWSLAPNSPLTYLTTSLESEKTSTTFPPSLLTMAIPTNKASYSPSLFMAENPNLKDFSTVIFSGDIKTIPTLDPFWLDTPSV